MREWIRRHQGLVATQLSLLSITLTVFAGFKLFGERLVRSGYEGESIAAVNRFFQPETPLPFEAVWRRANRDFDGILTVLIAIQLLALLVGLAASSPRRRIAIPLAFLGWWLAAETWATPHLVYMFRLRNYRVIRDVDHRPTHTGGGSNSDAVRGAQEPEEFRAADLSMLFLGDSFTFGLRVNAGQSFPYVVERRLRARHADKQIHVANFGWTSSSPLLSYRRLVDIGHKYEPDYVVMCIDMTDFGDDIRYGNMLKRRGIYWLYDKTPLLLKLIQVISLDFYKKLLGWTAGHPPGDRFFISNAPLEETRHWFQPLMDNVERVAMWSEEHGAEFILFVLPRCYQYSDREAPLSDEWESYTAFGPYVLEPFRFFDEVRPAVDYPIHSLLEAFQNTEVFPTCFEDDPHWNPEGHRVAAQAVLEVLAPEVDGFLAR